MNWRARIEPAALEALPEAPVLVGSATGKAEIAASIAISLRRIADTLDGTTGLSLAQAVENAIGTGMFHGFQNMKGRG